MSFFCHSVVTFHQRFGTNSGFYWQVDDIFDIFTGPGCYCHRLEVAWAQNWCRGTLMGDCKDMQGKEVTCGFNCFDFGCSEIAKLTISGQNGQTQRSE